MEDHEQEHPPTGSGENPDVPGIDQGPGQPDREPTGEGSGHSDGADSGGRAHTSTQEGHPAGDGERSDREVGGPKAADDAPAADDNAGVHGDIRTKGMPPHE